MICLSGSETRVADLARRVARGRAAGVELQELRIDLLERIDKEVFALIGAGDLIVTCRATRAGGGFGGDEAARLAVLRRALDAGPAYLDLELETDVESRRELFRRRGATKIIVSAHRFSAPTEAELEALASSLGAAEADLLKLAIAIDDAAELETLRRALDGARRPVLRVGMGPAGLLSRVLYRRFGSPWSYVVEDAQQAVAPGQLSLDRTRRLRLSRDLTPLGLLGGPQVLRSPGPRVYNALFHEHALPYLYLPVITARSLETLALLERLGFGGASVTMPAKERLYRHVAKTSDAARRAGALNTVTLGGRQPVGDNTDVLAVETLLSHCAGQRALLLGAGGAARAALAGLNRLGCQVSVANRSRGRAEAIAGGSARVIDWSSRGNEAFDLLVQATPCGADGKSDALPALVSLAQKTVLDAVVADGPTPLVIRARREGATVFEGRDWWLRQGYAQLQTLIGELPFSFDEMKETYDAPLA